MSEKSIALQVERIRKKRDRLLREAEKAAQREVKNDIRFSERHNHNIVVNIHDVLKRKIQSSCGLGDETEIWLSSDNLLPDSPEKAIDYVKDQTGLVIKPLPGELGGRIKVSLSGNGKLYSRYDNDRLIRLDFPALLQENAVRNDYWTNKRFFASLASDMIFDMQKCLEEMPNNFYGIRERTTILRDNGTTAFGGGFNFGLRHIEYCNLTDSQVADLVTNINAKVSHGEVVIHKAETCLWVYIKRMPDKVIENPEFDFKIFYDQFNDVVSDELRKVFLHINDNLEFADATSQVQVMKADPMIYYWFKKGDLKFSELKEHFAEGPHLQNMIQELNQLHPEILITSAKFANREEPWASGRGCARGTYSLDERIEFTYGVLDSTGEFLAQQQQVVAVTQEINTPSKVQNVAEAITNSILNEASQNDRLKGLIAPDCKPYHIKDEFLKVDVTAGGDKWTLDFCLIQHEVFLKRVENEISRLSDNLLTVDLKGQRYKLNFQQ